ncbi:MAG: aromatic aminobenezylarsenical efflux permease ArsG family transporter [bacterium]
MTIAIASAFWLGILTAICPCPMATNIAAISFISKRVDSPVVVLVTGVVYTLGRMIAYTVLGVLILQGLFASPHVSHLLQKYMGLLTGPLLVLVGMVLLQLISFPSVGIGLGHFQERLAKKGVVGAFFLGIFLALAFCPSSAAIYFGRVIPISVEQESALLIPCVYGIATGLPVIGVSFMIAFGANRIGAVYATLSNVEVWARRMTGILFLLVGLYFTVTLTAGIRF